MHRIIAIVFALLLLASADAQVPSGNVFVGYSYMSADLVSNSRTNLNGWNGSVEGKVLPFIGLVADFSGLYGSAPLVPNPACTGIIRGTCSPLSASTHIQTFLIRPARFGFGREGSAICARLDWGRAHQRECIAFIKLGHFVRVCVGWWLGLSFDPADQLARTG